MPWVKNSGVFFWKTIIFHHLSQFFIFNFQVPSTHTIPFWKIIKYYIKKVTNPHDYFMRVTNNHVDDYIVGITHAKPSKFLGHLSFFWWYGICNTNRHIVNSQWIDWFLWPGVFLFKILMVLHPVYIYVK